MSSETWADFLRRASADVLDYVYETWEGAKVRVYQEVQIFYYSPPGQYFRIVELKRALGVEAVPPSAARRGRR